MMLFLPSLFTGADTVQAYDMDCDTQFRDSVSLAGFDDHDAATSWHIQYLLLGHALAWKSSNAVEACVELSLSEMRLHSPFDGWSRPAESKRSTCRRATSVRRAHGRSRRVHVNNDAVYDVVSLEIRKRCINCVTPLSEHTTYFLLTSYLLSSCHHALRSTCFRH